MLFCIGVNAPVPEDAQMVVAVETRHSRIQSIFNNIKFRRHQRSHGIRRRDKLVCGSVAVGSRIVSARIPGAVPHRVFAFGTESLDNQTEFVGIRIIDIVALAIKNRDTEFVLLGIGTMGNRIHPNRIVVGIISCMALEQRSARRINSVGSLDPKFQVTQVFVLVVGMQHNIITQNRARKFVRLVINRLVSRTQPPQADTRRPYGITEVAEQGGIHVVTEMQIDALYRTRTTTRILTIESHQQAAAFRHEILDIRGHIHRIEQVRRTGRILKACSRFRKLVLVHGLCGIAHDVVIDPDVDLFKLVRIDRITETHLEAIGPAVGVLVTFANHRQVRNFTV